MKMTNSLGLAFRFVVEENILIISNLLLIQRQQTENNFLQKEKDCGYSLLMWSFGHISFDFRFKFFLTFLNIF